MAKRRPGWYVQREGQQIPNAFFISHVGEDGPDVEELKSKIEAFSGRGGRTPLMCFLDIANWPMGNVNSRVIREHLLKSRHMVVWATPAYLSTVRGWVWMELAYAELIELGQNVEMPDIQHPFIVPIFRNVEVQEIERTPLLKYWERKLFAPGEGGSIAEKARQLVDYYEQEALTRPAK